MEKSSIETCKLTHPELGVLNVCINKRARRIIFRASEDGLNVTVPRGTGKKLLLSTVEEMLPRLKQLIEKKKSRQIDAFIGPDFIIDSLDFKMYLKRDVVKRPAARFSGGTLVVSYPDGIDFSSSVFQQWLLKVAEESLRYRAKQLLPKRLETLANRFSFLYEKVNIHKTHGRWGSCSVKRHINLSLYLILLPQRLQEYVMLHELCHTQEMNHGPRFWAKLDACTNGQSDALRKEMKQFDTSIFTRPDQ